MRIFLDARDLIGLLDDNGPCSIDQVRERLLAGGHMVAITPTVVFEIAAPLVQVSTNTVVMQRLNALESLPLEYLADSQIDPRELNSALDCFTSGKEYVAIDPYVKRFDAAIPVSGSIPTAIYLHHSIAETVFTIWQGAPELLRRPTKWVDRLQAVMAADRSLTNTPPLASHFREAVRRHLQLYEISVPPLAIAGLADWIYGLPDRCPAVRLGYEVFHHLRRNIGDRPKTSDFGDLGHVRCLPYVDLMTLDRRMADYVRRSDPGWGWSPSRKVRHDLASVISEL